MSLVSTKWLIENIDKVKVFDSSWHLPDDKRNNYQEYITEHIPNSIFFDIDKNSDHCSNLPHMIPSKKNWEKIMSSFGILNDDKIIIYDNSNLISSCRLWFTFLYFGHNKELVHVLNGGLNKWKKESLPLTNKINNLTKSSYRAVENKKMVKNILDIKTNIQDKVFKLIDGRSRERFEGKIPEPREGVRSGSIKDSFCLPFQNVINDDKTFKNKVELKNIFDQIIYLEDKNNVVFSCGSGITSCVLALAYSLINNNYTPTIYDGSWAEYGKIII